MKQLKILFEDDYFVIVDKPANLLSTPDRFRSELPSLKSLLRNKYGEIFVLHRLDLETSGAIAFGKKPEIQQVFTEMQINNEVQKTYIAFVEGQTHVESGIINAPLIYDGGKTYVNLKDKKAKASITHYKVLETIGQYSIIQCQIKSGRTHQIRVHLAHIGLPLAVDKFYGRNEAIFLSEFKKKKYRKKRDEDERALISRLTLHASILEYEHPITRENIRVDSDLHKDMRALKKQLKKNIG